MSQAAYAFWQYDLCDTFIEVSKPWFAATEGSAEAPPEQQAARETLWLSLDSGLRHEAPPCHGVGMMLLSFEVRVELPVVC